MAKWLFGNAVRRSLLIAVLCSAATIHFYRGAQQIESIRGNEIDRFLLYSGVEVFGVLSALWWVRLIAAIITTSRQRRKGVGTSR
jgi:hypothetical protein